MDLNEKIVVVTGASSGIGKTTAIKLAEKGAKVALLARRKQKLEDVEKIIEDKKGEALVVETDVTDEENVKESVKEISEKYGKIDVLINIAGLGIFENVEDLKSEDWYKQINVMLNGCFLMTHHCLPYLKKNNKGHIINLTSLWAKKYCAKCAGYTAAKFGVRGFTKSLREELRENNIKVTNVMPGTVDTPFFDKAEWETDLTKAIQPEDVAETIAFVLELPDRAVIEELEIQAIKPDQD